MMTGGSDTNFQPTEYLVAPNNYFFTGVTAQTGIEMECQIKRGNWGSGVCISGVRESGSTQPRIFLFGYNGTAAIGADNGWINDGNIFSQNTLAIIKSGILSDRQYLIINGSTKIDQSEASNIYYGDSNLPIGGYNYAGAISTIITMPTVTYYPHFKLTLNGNLVRDYIPGYRKTDNAGGMYDLQGSICPDTGTPFYPFSGTGTITFGNDV